MLSKIPFLPGGLALLATACAVPQPGIRRSAPIDHTVLRADLLTDRQNVEEREINLLTAFGNLANLENRKLSVHLSAVLEAPEIEGIALKVVRILQHNNLLIVAYAGSGSQGALALIDVSDPDAPELRGELQLPTLAVAAIATDGKQLYFAGPSSEHNSPVLGVISFQDGELLDDLKLQVLDLKSVQSIALLDERIVVMDQSNAQLVSLQRKDFRSVSKISLPHLSQLSQDATSLWALTREPSAITQLDAALKPLARIPEVGENKNPLFAGEIRSGRETVLAALGDGGIRAFCKADHKALFNVPAVVRADLDRAQSPSLGASLSQGLLLTANADAGVYLYQVSTEDKDGACNERVVRFEGYLDLGKQFRAEALNWQDGVLSVGDGQGRLSLFSLENEALEGDDKDYDR